VANVSLTMTFSSKRLDQFNYFFPATLKMLLPVRTTKTALRENIALCQMTFCHMIMVLLDSVFLLLPNLVKPVI